MIIKSLQRIRQYWKEAAHSRHCKMSRGAEQAMRMITRAHGENWRPNHPKSKK